MKEEMEFQKSQQEMFNAMYDEDYDRYTNFKFNGLQRIVYGE